MSSANSEPLGCASDYWCGGDEIGRSSTPRGESLENARRRFKRNVQQEDIIRQVKRHSFYLKPGENKRVKEALARKRARMF
jgi:small subunit ribosomal protein S21